MDDRPLEGQYSKLGLSCLARISLLQLLVREGVGFKGSVGGLTRSLAKRRDLFRRKDQELLISLLFTCIILSP